MGQNVDLTLDELVNSQYYNGHGHSFYPSELKGCLFFSIPLYMPDSVDDLIGSIKREINANEVLPIYGGCNITITEDQVNNSIKNSKTIIERFYLLMTCAYANLTIKQLKECDIYLYGYLHVYEES